LLAEGYVYPREQRGARDLARKRMQLVRYRTAQVLSIEGILMRQTGSRLKGEAVKRLTAEQVDEFGFAPDVALALEANRAVSQALGHQIELLEKRLQERVSLRPVSGSFARHLKPIQLLFDLIKSVVADFVVVSHRKNGFACGTERSTTRGGWPPPSHLAPREFSGFRATKISTPVTFDPCNIHIHRGVPGVRCKTDA